MKLLVKFLFALICFTYCSYGQTKNLWSVEARDSIGIGSNLYQIYNTNIDYKPRNAFSNVVNNEIVFWGINYNHKTDSAHNISEDIVKINTTTKERKTLCFIPDNGSNTHNWKAVARPNNNLIVLVGDSTRLHFYWSGFYYFISTSIMTISRNAGKDWETIAFDTNKVFLDISMIDSLNGVILERTTYNYYNWNDYYTACDTLLITNDSWKSYTRKALPSTLDKDKRNPRIFTSTKNHILAFMANELMVSNDTGNSWVTKKLCDSNEIINDQGQAPNARFYPPARITIFGYSTPGTVPQKVIPFLALSNDTGSTWKKYYFDSESELINDVDFLNDSNAIAVTSKGRILRTNNCWKTWDVDEVSDTIDQKSQNDLSDLGLTHIEYINDSTAIAFYRANYYIKYDKRQALARPQFIIDSTNAPGDIDANLQSNYMIKWSKIDGAVNYRLRIQKVDPDSSKIMTIPDIDTVLTSDSYLYNNLEHYKSYLCWIKAIGNGIESQWSMKKPLFNTTKKRLLYPPNILSPAENDTIDPTNVLFVWNKNGNSNIYNVYLKNLTLDSLIIDRRLADTSIIYDQLIPESAYQLLVSSTLYVKEYPGYINSGQKERLFFTSKIVSVNWSNESNGFIISPNPSNEYIIISPSIRRLQPAATEADDIRIYNTLGECVKKPNPSPTQGVGVRIDVSDLVPGLYYCTVRSGMNRITKSFAVVR